MDDSNWRGLPNSGSTNRKEEFVCLSVIWLGGRDVRLLWNLLANELQIDSSHSSSSPAAAALAAFLDVHNDARERNGEHVNGWT